MKSRRKGFKLARVLSGMGLSALSFCAHVETRDIASVAVEDQGSPCVAALRHFLDRLDRSNGPRGEFLLPPLLRFQWASRLAEETPAALKPFILTRGSRSSKVVLLVHAMAKSPAQTRSFAESYFALGFNVVSILLPAHGRSRLFFAQSLMEPAPLVDLWEREILFGLQIAAALGDHVVVNGFSLGASASEYTLLRNPGLAQEYIATSPSSRLHRVALRLAVETQERFADWMASNPARSLLENPYLSGDPNWAQRSEFNDIGYTDTVTPGVKFAQVLQEALRLEEAKRDLGIPAFVSWSEFDRIVDPDEVAKLARRLSAEIYVVPKEVRLSHDATFSGPEAQAFVQAQSRWLIRPSKESGQKAP